MNTRIALILAVGIVILTGCSEDNGSHESIPKDLTIFFINDHHGQLDNFSKIDDIVDMERLTTNVILACSGDMFSGNPVVDNYPEKGIPIIDVMNRCGFDVAVIGNHEYDYGVSTLSERI